MLVTLGDAVLPPFLGLSQQKAPSVRRESARLVPKLIANAMGCFSLMLAIASRPLIDDMVCVLCKAEWSVVLVSDDPKGDSPQGIN